MSDDTRSPTEDPFADLDSPGPATDRTRPEAEDVAARHGRHLFALAYHLCGDADQAEALSRRLIAGHGLAPDAADTDPAAISIDLFRGLLARWKSDRAGRRRPREPAMPRGPAGDRAARGQPARRPLHRALEALDADARMITVLRVAEGLDYEEIAALLHLPGPHVRGALLTGRRLLQAAMHGRSIDPSQEMTMTLYLDDRLPAADLAEFEARLSGDTALRLAVEFHRGLTLEFHEEVPPLPGDFVGRVLQERERMALERGPSARSGTAPRGRPAVRRQVVVTGVALVVAALLVASLWRARTGTAPAGPGPQSPTAPPAGAVEGGEVPDEETAKALRARGDIAGDRESIGSEKRSKPRTVAAVPHPAASAATPATRTETAAPEPASQTAEAPAPQPAPSGPPPAAGATESPAQAAGAPPEPAAEADTAPPGPAATTPADQAAPPTGPPPAATTVRFRTIVLERAPEIGRDHLVIRSAEQWAAFAGEAPAPADFAAEMVIVVRDALGDQPPTRLILDEVRSVDGVLEIVARVAEAAPGGAPAQGIVVPATDRAVRLVVR